MDFYERLNSLIKSQGLSQRKVELELGLSNGAISKWKKYTPNIDKVNSIAKYFHVPIEWLLTGEEKSESQGYYLNSETAEMAQSMFDDPDMRTLFDMKRNMPPERFAAHVNFMKELYENEKKNRYDD